MIKIGKDISDWGSYSCRPKTKEELRDIIDNRISKEGNECDLNDIDTSLIDDMAYLFFETEFVGNISKWNVSNCTTMLGMFYKSKFNGDISNWDVSNVNSMVGMFNGSCFNQDISSWDVSNVRKMGDMFCNCKKFNQDISSWDVSKVKTYKNTFENCPIEYKYKPKF